MPKSRFENPILPKQKSAVGMFDEDKTKFLL